MRIEIDENDIVWISGTSDPFGRVFRYKKRGNY